MNKKFKIVFLIISVLVILFCIYKIINTYAVFYSEADGKIAQKIGNWTIKVNNLDVSKEIVENFTIDQIELSSDKNVKEGKIAPGLEGSFLITIDPSNTDVSIRYDIVFDTSLLETNNLKLSTVEEIALGNNIVKTQENCYTGIISLSQIKQKATNQLKVTIDWENVEDFNKEDTEMGSTKNAKVNIPITVRVTQYLGEEIISI